MTSQVPPPRPESEPPSRRLARLLRDEIASGKYAPGDKLPTERALAEEHGISRNTASSAIRILVGEGLVVTQQGSGAYVRGTPRLMRIGARRYSSRLREDGLSPFRAEVVRQGRTPSVACRSITRIAPPPEVAERLELDPVLDAVVRRENHYLVDGAPVQIGVTYAPWSVVDGSVISYSTELGAGGIYARFDELGRTVARAREEVSARMPIAEEAATLGIPPGVPVLELLHTSIDQDGRSFEVTRFVMRADHMALDYDIPVED